MASHPWLRASEDSTFSAGMESRALRFGRRQKPWILACRRRRGRRTLCLEWRCVWAGDWKIFYFAPDTLRWESMNNMGYSELLVWALGDKLSRFYASLRWDGWESEVSFMGGDSALSVYPFLWSKEGMNIVRSSRKACPIEEVYELNVVDLPAQ